MILMVPVLVIAALAQQKQADAKQEESKGLERLTRAERFQGALTAKAKDGKAVPVQVALRTWSVRAGPGALRLPDQGFLVIQLHSGKLKTTMDGKQQERHEGEFWVVPVGAQMSIEVVSETAVLQTATFGKP
jgi:glucose/arabinose dehydrogenase